MPYSELLADLAAHVDDVEARELAAASVVAAIAHDDGVSVAADGSLRGRAVA